MRQLEQDRLQLVLEHHCDPEFWGEIYVLVERRITDRSFESVDALDRYLRKTIAHECRRLRHLRQQPVLEADGQVAKDLEPLASLIKMDEQAKLQDAMELLPSDHRQAIAAKLRFPGSPNVSELARATNLSRWKINGQAASALKLIKKRLGSRGPNDD